MVSRFTDRDSPVIAEVDQRTREIDRELIHIHRFDHQDGEQVGPDSFYAGMLHAESLLREGGAEGMAKVFDGRAAALAEVADLRRRLDLHLRDNDGVFSPAYVSACEQRNAAWAERDEARAALAVERAKVEAVEKLINGGDGEHDVADLVNDTGNNWHRSIPVGLLVAALAAASPAPVQEAAIVMDDRVGERTWTAAPVPVQGSTEEERDG